MTTSQIETLRDTINDALQVITNASKQINQTPDPYAELKKAHAEGKVIQYRDDHMGAWVDCISPIWVNDTDATPNPRYRLKPEEPWTLGRQLPGFRALRDGEEWLFPESWNHRDLDDGYRPCIKGEMPLSGDQYRKRRVPLDRWDTQFGGALHIVDHHYDLLHRTKRPLPFLTPEQIAEGWIEWHGGENPVPGKMAKVMFRYCGDHARRSNEYRWEQRGTADDIIAYRVIEPRVVPLGPDDVRCGDEVRLTDTRYCIAQVESDGVFIANYGRRSFTQLQDAWKIRRRNSATFEPCSKEAAE